MGLTFKGRKASSGSSRKATRHDDSLFGQDTVELLLSVGEGPIEGFKDGAASFRVGDVPLLDKGSQTPNISNFELRLLKGTNPADSIRLNLGGVSATKNVGLDLRVANQQIIVQGDKTQIDYIDLRFVVQRLLSVSKEGGEFPIDVQFKVEVKPRSSSTWAIPFDNQPPPPVENTSGASNYRPGASTPGTVVNDTYRETYIQADAPTAPQSKGAMWFVSTATNWKPKIWNGTAWVDPTGLTAGSRSGFPIWTWTDLDGAARTAWYSPGGEAPPPGTLAKGDFLLTPQSGEEVYSYNETSWVGAQEFASPTPAAPGVITINGLTRSSYPKEYRIPVTRINEPYDVRVTRISPASTKDIFRDINFESIQQVNRDLVSFPDLAVIWLTIKATDTFTSIPDFTSVMRGVRIPVPSNHVFNETTNLSEYPGIWDGTFKIAYTNSPAWWAYNFIKNSRYGKNSYFPEIPDQWDFYEFGKHCSAHGFRFNEFIQEPRSLNELINYIVGIAGGRYVDRGDGYSTVIWDADNQVAQAIFAPENTIEGSFTYSFTDVTERKNDFKVSFKNPALNYREDRLRVYDQNTIDAIGRNAEEFVAVGCRDPEEAVKRGRLRLATALTEKIIVSFKTNRIGRYLLPFQVILIADDQSTNVISGRIKNPDPLPAGSVSLPLRDQIYLEAGITYTAQFTISDGNGGLKVVSYPLTVATPGLQNQLTLSNALTEALPEYAVFSIGAPKPFRITSITPADDDPDQVEITAIEVNRLKWAFVDGQVQLRDITALQTGALSKFVYPVTGAKIVPETTTSGQLNLVATWNPSETKLVRGYRVYQSINMEPMELVGEPSSPRFQISNAKAATYILSIVAVGLDGTTESAPVTVSYVISNGSTLRSVAPPTNLRLVDEPEAPIFRAVNPRFTWDAAADPLVAKYLVEVVSPTNAVVYSERVEGQPLFNYTLTQNKASNGGTPLRQFTVRVRSIDSTGAFSAPVNLVVSHPAPAAIPFTLSAVSETVFATTTPPTGDWAGTMVWMEKVSGFNPATTTPKADDKTAFFALPATAETTYYLRAAAYDSYGKTGLNYAPEQSIKASILLFDPNAPARPGKPTLTTGTEIGPDGTLTSWVKAVVPAVTSDNLAFYEIDWQIGSGDWERRKYDTNTATMRGFQPATVVNVKASSVSKMGFPSDYSDVATITTAKNLVAPANPTNPLVNAGFERAIITWTAPANLDLKWIEVWGADVSSASTTPVGVTGSRLIGYAPKGQTQFWDTLSTTGTRTYWLRSVNTSDVAATSFVRAGVGTSAALQAQQLASGIIDATKMATSLEVPRVVSTLPTTKAGQFVTLESDGKLYRWDVAAGRYTTAVPAVDVGPGLTADQIASVNAASVAGQLSNAQIAGIAAGKVAGELVNATLQAANLSGQITSAQVAALAASKITGQLTNAQLEDIQAAKIAGQLTDAQLAGLSAAKLSGTIVANQIAAGVISMDKLATGLRAVETLSALPTTGNVDGRMVYLTADKKLYRYDAAQAKFVASVSAADIAGQLAAAQIAALEASKITGQMSDSQIAAVAAAKVAGQLSDTQLAGISAGKVAGALVNATLAANSVTGQLSSDQIASLAATKVAGTLSDAQIAGIAAGKITGQLVTAQIADAALTAAKFGPGIEPIATVSALPNPAGYTGPKVVLLTTDGRIYRYLSGAWTTAVAAGDIAGTLAASQIAALEASKITGQLSDAQLAAVSAAKISGQIVAAQIADAQLTAAKFASGLRPIEILATLPTTGNFEGRMVFLTSDDKLYRHNGTSFVSSVAAADISGTIQAAQIAALEASKITGQLSDAQLAAVSAAKVTGQIVAAQIADAQLTAAKFTAGVRPIEIVSSLPTTGNFEGRIVFLTSDDKLYRHNGTSFVSSIPASDIAGTVQAAQIAALEASKITGQMTSAQIAALDAVKLTGTISTSVSIPATTITGTLTDNQIGSLAATKISGTLTDNQIAGIAAAKISGQIVAAQLADGSLTAAKFGSSIKPVEVFASLPTTGNVEGRMVYNSTDNKLYRYIGNAWTAAVAAGDITGMLQAAQIATLTAGQITGTLADNQIAAVSASKLAGTLSDAQLAGISAAKVSGALVNATLAASGLTGTISSTQLAAIEAAKVTGTLTADQIASINAASVAGTLSDAQLAGISAAKVSGALTAATLPTTRLSGTITDSQIAAMSAAKLAGQITGTQITDNAITTAKIAAGAITADQIAVNAITASKITVGDWTNLFSNPVFRDGTDNWTGVTTVIDTAVTTGGIYANAPSRFCGQNTVTSATQDIFGTGDIPVTAGEVWYLAVDAARAAVATTEPLNLYIRTFDAVMGSGAPRGLRSIAPNSTWATYDAQFVVPTGVAFIRAGLRINGASPAGGWAYTNFKLRRMASSELIVDGAVIADKVAADAITAGKIAANAITAREITAGTITGNEIKSATILAGNIAANAITTTQLNANAVTTAKIATNAVTANEIAAGTITATEIASGAITTAKLFAGAVTAGTIATDAVVAGKIAANAITAREITANTITATEIKAGTITAAEIAANAITTTQLNADAVTAAKIATGAVVADAIAANAVTATKILAGSIATAHMTAGSINADRLVANSITTAQLAADSVTTTQLKAGSVTTDSMAAGAITAAKIASNTITATQLAANSVTTSQLAANAVVAGKIAADAVTATTIAAGAVTADAIAANAITAGKINASAITARELAAGSIIASKLAIATINLCSAGDLSQGLNSVTSQTSGVTGMTTSALTIQAGAGPDALPAARFNITGTITAGSFFINVGALSTAGANGLVTRISVTPGQYYEASAYPVSNIAGTSSRMEIVWEKSDGSASTISASTVGTYITAPTSTSGSLDTRGRCFVLAQAPSDAAQCYIRVRFIVPANSVNPQLYAGGFMLAPGSAGQVEPSPYVAPGVTTIDGGNIVTNSITARSIVANTITANEIKAGTITATELSSGSITTAKLVAGAVTADQVGANAITAAKIQAGAVTTASMTAGSINADRLVASSITAGQIAANAITATQLAAGSVTADTLAAGAITAGKIAANAVTATTIATGAVAADQIAANAVTAAKVMAGAIQTAALAAGAVTADTIAANAITAAKISAGAVTTASMTAGTINGDRLVASSITAGQIAANAITATQLAAGSVATDNLAAGAITAAKIASATITATQLAAGAVVADKIAAGAVSAAKLAADSVTAAAIAAGAVVADAIAANAITAAKIQAGAVQTAHMTAGSINADRLVANSITASQIAANAITTTQLAAGSVTTDSLVAGAITADKVAANAILASKIIVTDWANCFGNPVFEGGSTDSWTGVNLVIDTAVTTGGIYANAPSRFCGQNTVKTSTQDIVGTGYIPVTPGEVWYLAVDAARVSGSTAEPLVLYIRSFDGNKGSGTPRGLRVIAPNSTWNTYDTQYTIPSGVAFIYAGLRINSNSGAAGGWAFTNFKLRRAASAELIVDGAVTAAKVAAGAIVAGKIDSGAVTADKIAANAVTAGKIDANAITAREIVAGSIVGSKLAIATGNVIYNGDGSQGTLGWDVGSNTAGGVQGPSIDTFWAPGSQTAIRLLSTILLADAAGKIFDLRNWSVAPDGTKGYYPVRTGTTYEFSACMSSHRCSGQLRIVWRDSAGGAIQDLGGSSVPSNGANGGPISSFPKVQLIAVAPANATQVQVYFRAHTISGDNPNIFVSCPMLAPTSAGATETSPYVPAGITTINGGNLLTNSVTARTIVAGTITSAEIAAGTISAGNIAANAITTTQLNANAVTTAKIATGAITADQVAANAITAVKIQAGAIETAKLAAGAVQAGNIAAGAVTADKIQANAISATHIAAGTITATELAAGAVTADKVAANAILASKIIVADWANSIGNPVFEGGSDDSWTSVDLVIDTATQNTGIYANAPTRFCGQNTVKAGAQDIFATGFVPVTPGEVWYLAVDAARVSGSAVEPLNLYFRTFDAQKGNGVPRILRVIAPNSTWNTYDAQFTIPAGVAFIRAGLRINAATNPASGWAYTSAKLRRASSGELIVDGAVTADKIAANAVTAAKIVAGSITATQIAANAITASQLNAGAVTTAKIAANAVTANEIAAATITGTEIKAGAIATAHLTASVVQAGNIAAGAVAAGKIAANAVTANEILARTITASQIAVGTLTANELAANSVTTTQLAAGAVQAGNVAAGAIVAGKIGVNAVTANEIASRTITANQIAVGTLTANELAANSVTAAKIVAGAIGVDQLAAGAIVADKIGVGLNTGNLLANSDVTGGIGNFYLRFSNAGVTGINFRNDWCPPGMGSVYVQAPATAANTYTDICYQQMQANGTWLRRIPIVGGQRYEITVYTSNHRCTSRIVAFWYDAAGASINATELGDTQPAASVGQNQPLTNYNRNGVFWQAPSNAASVEFGVRARPDASGQTSGSFCFTFGWMLAKALPNQTEFSPYAPQSVSVIDGGSIAANTVTATQIQAGTITTDLLQAGSINVDTIAAAGSISANKLKADVLTAGSITVSGSTKLSSWATGTQINGGVISANSIQSGSLTITSRGISITNMDFTYNQATRQVSWTAGTFGYINDNDAVATVNVAAGSLTLPAGNTYFYWTQGATALSTTATFTTAVAANTVHIATYNSATGLVVYRGSAMIDGSRIVAASITSDLIAAGAVQTGSMAANSINGDRITAGTIAAAKIVANSITSGQLAANSVTATQIAANAITASHITAGTITATSGIIANGAITNAMIADATITSAKIGLLQVDSARIADLTVGNTKIADLAVTNGTGATSAAGVKTASITLNVRRANSKVLVIATRSGFPGATYAIATNTGRIQTSVTPPGGSAALYDDIAAAYTTTYVSGQNTTYVTLMPTCQVLLYTASAAGNYTFSVADTNNASAAAGSANYNGNVGIYVLELSK